MNPLNCPGPEILCFLIKALAVLLNYQSEEDLNSPKQLTDGDVYDFIIVGAGPAGCVLANRLSELKECKVLLLEAGGEEPKAAASPAFTPFTWGTRLNWNYTTQPDERRCGGKPCVYYVGKGLGGSTLHFDMIFNRGNWRTFDLWKDMGNYGWGYEEVLSYFKKSENNLDAPVAKNTKYHGVGGPQSVGKFPYTDKNMYPFLNAFKELGYEETDFNTRNQTGVMGLQFFQCNGSRQTSNHAYLPKNIRNKRKHLTVVTNVMVTKVIINKETKRAEGVEYVWEHKRHIKGTVYARKEVIISAGPFNSPKLLMLSGIGPKEILEPLEIQVLENLAVGQNLQNHIQAGDIDFTLSPQQRTMDNNEGIMESIMDYVQNQRGPLSGEGPYEVGAYINSKYNDPSLDFPDIHFYINPKTLSNSSNVRSSFLTPFCFYDRLSISISNVKPRNHGYMIINSTDPFTHPLIYPNYFENETDVKVLIDGYRFIVDKLSKTNTLNDLGIILDTTPMPPCDHLQFDTDEYWMCLIENYESTDHHFCGTCKMGPSGDRTAVVDPRLKVHNITGLRVIDTSIMPEIINGNTAAAALMIGEKGVDMIKDDWK